MLDSTRPVPQKSKTVVIVEDLLIAKLVRTVLRKHGYSVLVAEPSEAAGLLRAPEGGGGTLVTNSPAIFLEFAERVPLLYLSSSPDPQLEARFRTCRVVRKPFAPDELIHAAGELTGVL